MSAVPTPYDRQTRFGSASSNNPSKPIQGTDLDKELDAVEVALDQTQARLAEIQRDDGALANQSVGLEQLKPEALEDLHELTVEWSEEAVQPALDQMAQMLGQAQAAEADAEAAAAQAEACRDQSCECAADSQLFAIESEEHADDSEESAVNSAASADLARYYYNELSGALEALAPQTIILDSGAGLSTYELPVPVSSEEFLDIYVDGALLSPDAYTVNGTTLTFTPPIPGGHEVVIKIASSVQIMPIVVDDWGYVYESVSSAEDWGEVTP